MEKYGLLVIALGVCLFVLQFYVEYESSGALDKDTDKKKEDEKIAKYKEQKDKGEIIIWKD
ncbi:hypothetical protein [Aliarcobacter butzleri]|uniref:hypothetical protein n=1 Tax=Aliarcobacter butzleri TaxID=28197 RepID=UPI0021B1690F|nr:hypothetical protein [Aliarcobacter butzleri]MCT7567404.1 hypothetical protein [Aliarcobacter butzleri]